MPATLTLDGTAVDVPDVIGDDEFELDLRVVEAVTPEAFMRCDTSDQCGATCSTSACSTGSMDPS